jgi:hypothetical protein
MMADGHETGSEGARSVRGGVILDHRSLRRIPLSRRLVLTVVLLPVLLNLLTWWGCSLIGTVWASLFSFWIEKLDLIGSVERMQAPGVSGFESALPWVGIACPNMDTTTWWVTLVVTALALLATKFIPEKNVLPLRYFIWFAGLIQVIALVFFAVDPAGFPFTLSDYVRGSTRIALWLLFLIPWMHALVYYVFDFSLVQKISFTLLTLGFIIIAVPFQLMLHAYLIAKASLLLLPLLYFLFGMPLLVFACVALYGWGMSWRPSNP